MPDFSNIIEPFLCLFFPRRCLVCQDIVSYNRDFCGKCVREKCDPEYNYSKIPIAISCAYMYTHDMPKAVSVLKKIPDKRMARFYGSEVFNAINFKFADVKFDALISVPMSGKMKRKCGFNHAEVLARQVAEHMGIPVITDALIRTDDSLMQRSLNAGERKANAMRSYRYSGKADIGGKTLLIIDDVITTGSTIEACAKILLSAGAKYVAAASITIVSE